MPKTPSKPTQKAVRAARALEPVPHPGLNFSHKHHVFIAKAKRGELWALNHLSVAARAAVTPLFEMFPPSIPRKKKDGKTPKPAKPLAAHANDLLTPIKNEWALPFFMDTRFVASGGVPSPSGVKTFFDAARALSLTTVPVTSIRFAPAYQHEIRDVISTDQKGVMIRLSLDDFANPAKIGNFLTALMGVLGVSPAQTDILIDLELKPSQIEVQTVGAALLSMLPSLSQWRTVTLAAGCFPQSISTWGKGTWHPVVRSDWVGWSQLLTQYSTSGTRKPSYGDYGIRCGGTPKDIPNRPDPNIRYTHIHKILVRREPKTAGRLKLICSSLIALPEFSGATFSQGDKELAARAAMPGSPSNSQAEYWIQWCTNHHLELTASQIRSLP